MNRPHDAAGTPYATRRHGDAGFTLAELMVVIAILGFIGAALGTAMTVAFRTAYGAADRMDRSHDANLVGTYLDPDLASASSAATGGTACSGVPNELALTWTEEITAPSGAVLSSTTYVAAYAVVADGSSYLMRRYLCTGGGSPAANTVAHDLTGAGAVTVTVASGAVAMTVEEGTGDAAYTYTVTGVVGARTA